MWTVHGKSNGIDAWRWLRLQGRRRRLILLSLCLIVSAVSLAGSLAYLARPGHEEASTSAPINRIGDQPLSRAFAGRPLVEDRRVPAAAADVRRDLAQGALRNRGMTAYFYGDPARRDLVLVMSMPARIADADSQLTGMLRLVRPSTGAMVTDVKVVDVDAGAMARCGLLAFEGSPATVCAWGERRSAGLMVWFYQPPADLQAELAEARQRIQQDRA